MTVDAQHAQFLAERAAPVAERYAGAIVTGIRYDGDDDGKVVISFAEHPDLRLTSRGAYGYESAIDMEAR